MTDRIPSKDFGGVGQRLLFAHANAYPPGTYRALLERLSRSYRVLAVKHRPLWGRENPEDFFRWEQIAQDIIAFCDQNGFRRLIGVGHSLGAVANMMAAHGRPDLFQVLVLIEPVFLPPAILDQFAGEDNIDNRSQWPWVATALNRRDLWPSRQEAYDHFRRKEVFSRWSDEVLTDYINSGLRLNNQGHYELTYPREWEARIYTLPPTEVWNSIPQIEQPTLAVRGADSNTLSYDAWALWQERQPQATFVELADSGHLLPMENPLILADTILEFLIGQSI